MVAILVILIAASAIPLILWSLRRRRKQRRERRRASPFPKAWTDILIQTMPLYRRLPHDLRQALCGHIQVFLAEKRFEGCQGLIVTDEMRLVVAAYACLLIINRDPPLYYPSLSSILIYPTSYLATAVEPVGGHYLESQVWYAGESSDQGSLIIAWDEVTNRYAERDRAYNVILHEFAHQLDQLDGLSDSIPPFRAAKKIKIWADILSKEYDALQRAVDHNHPTLIDDYGATNPGEFFAVVTELFFEDPGALKARHAELYAALRDYYRLDPAAWPATS